MFSWKSVKLADENYMKCLLLLRNFPLILSLSLGQKWSILVKRLKEDTKIVQRAFGHPKRWPPKKGFAQLPVFPAWNHNSWSARDGHTGHKKCASRPEINTPLLLGSHEEKLSTGVSSFPLCCTFWNFSFTSPIICLQGGVRGDSEHENWKAPSQALCNFYSILVYKAFQSIFYVNIFLLYENSCSAGSCTDQELLKALLCLGIQRAAAWAGLLQAVIEYGKV